MALPTKTEVQTGEFSADGSPAINVAAKAAVDTDTLEYSVDGSPWWGAEETSTPATVWVPMVTWWA